MHRDEDLCLSLVVAMTRVGSTGGSTSQWLAAPMDAAARPCGDRPAETDACRETSKGEKVLSVACTRELTTANASKFRERVIAALSGHDVIEVDLSGTIFLDCGGLGALIALNNATRDRKGRMRLLYPTPPVVQVLYLLEAQRVFEIVMARSDC